MERFEFIRRVGPVPGQKERMGTKPIRAAMFFPGETLAEHQENWLLVVLKLAIGES